MKSIEFPYKIYKKLACPIATLQVQIGKRWMALDAYVDSGASVSVFSVQEATRLGINCERGKVIYSTVGDGSLIPVYLHKLPVKIGDIPFKAIIGFSPRLGVGFNLLGRKDFFTRFDITFSDATKTLTFSPRK